MKIVSSFTSFSYLYDLHSSLEHILKNIFCPFWVISRNDWNMYKVWTQCLNGKTPWLSQSSEYSAENLTNLGVDTTHTVWDFGSIRVCSWAQTQLWVNGLEYRCLLNIPCISIGQMSVKENHGFMDTHCKTAGWGMHNTALLGRSCLNYNTLWASN